MVFNYLQVWYQKIDLFYEKMGEGGHYLAIHRDA